MSLRSCRRDSVMYTVLFVLVTAAMGCQPIPESTVSARSPAPARPRIQFVETDVDLGEIVVSAEGAIATFRFVNRGDAPLTIHELTKHCACAGVAISSSVINPGGAGVVQVTIRPQKAEKRSTSVTVHCDDPLQPQTSLIVSWRSLAALETDPLTLELGALTAGETGTGRLRIVRRANPEKKLEIKGVRCQPKDVLSASYVPAQGDAQPEEVHVRLQAGSEWKAEQGLVMIDVGGDAETVISVPVSWKVTGNVTVVPSRLFLGSMQRGAAFHAALIVMRDRAPDAIVGNVSAEPGIADLQWDSVPTDSGELRLPLTGTAPEAAGIASGEFVVLVNCPDPQEFRIPWTAVIRDPGADSSAVAGAKRGATQ